MMNYPSENKETDDRIDYTDRDIVFLGERSDEIGHDLNQLEKQERKEIKLLEFLCESAREEKILWGKVVGVEESSNLGKIVIEVLYDKAKILIPSGEYFEKDYLFGNGDDPDAYIREMNRHARKQIGANVCFILSHASRVIEKGTPAYIFGVGSRVRAMKRLREIWFFSPEERALLGLKEPGKGLHTRAKVLMVVEDYAVVECFGVETLMNRHTITDSYVDNCTDAVSPGDVIPVRIKKLYCHPDKRITLRLTAHLNKRPGAFSNIQVGTCFAGKVYEYNPNKSIYSIMLVNGVNAMVRKKDVVGQVPLSYGEQVSVVITKIFERFVQGKCMKL